MKPNNFGNLSNKDMDLMMERYKQQLYKLQRASTPMQQANPVMGTTANMPTHPIQPPIMGIQNNVVAPVANGEAVAVSSPIPVVPVVPEAIEAPLVDENIPIFEDVPDILLSEPFIDVAAPVTVPVNIPSCGVVSEVVPEVVEEIVEEIVEEEVPKVVVEEEPMTIPEVCGEPSPIIEPDRKVKPSEFPPLGMCDMEKSMMTTSQGHPMDSFNITTLGENGPALLRDVAFIDKMAHFDRERIPERVVHAKGAGAFGNFVPYASMSKYTKANFLSAANKSCPAFVRFSTVIGSSGSADTARDPRGFAVKLYTDEGNYDIVGLNFPVFFINDAMKFPDLIHSLKPSPLNNCTYKERFFDFASMNPETSNMITYLYSDDGTVRSYRTMNGFGINTYIWVNAEGKRHFVKYHWKSQQGVSNLSNDEAIRLAGENPNVATQDLYNAIANGEKVRYELLVQLIDPDVDQVLPFNPLDATKIWDENMFPLMPVGMLTLDKNPENFFVEVEQSAFSPSNFVPGVEISGDKMLEGRVFSYADAQRYRIGANFAQLPSNAPKSPVSNGQSGGASAMHMPSCPNVNYAPNILNHNQPTLAAKPEYKGAYHCGNIGNYNVVPQNDFSQAGEHFRKMTEEQKAAVVHNLAYDLVNCTPKIIEAFMQNLIQIDMGLAQRVAFAISAK